VLPGLARGALDRHLAQRGLPVTPTKWNPATPLLGSLEGEAGITPKRLWAIVKRLFATTANVLGDTNPALAEKLRRATPHWMRHTHATHALQRGAELRGPFDFSARSDGSRPPAERALARGSLCALTQVLVRQ
jgi:site-specific recombinase XerD